MVVLIENPLPIWKRTMDVVVSSLALAILSPLLLFVAGLIKSVSPGPVFFKQERVGHGGRMFKCLKFRTMKCSADASPHKQYVSDLINGDKPLRKLAHDSRIIPFGKLIRLSCIDEIPQFLNVLKGDMSLVGPRPAIPYEVYEYQRWQKGRFDVTPGITGLWQVSGKEKLTFRQMVRLDIRYARNMSFVYDMKILLKTPLVVFKQIEDSLAARIQTEGAMEDA